MNPGAGTKLVLGLGGRGGVGQRERALRAVKGHALGPWSLVSQGHLGAVRVHGRGPASCRPPRKTTATRYRRQSGSVFSCLGLRFRIRRRRMLATCRKLPFHSEASWSFVQVRGGGGSGWAPSCFLRFVGGGVCTCCVCTYWVCVYAACRHSMVYVQVCVYTTCM